MKDQVKLRCGYTTGTCAAAAVKAAAEMMFSGERIQYTSFTLPDGGEAVFPVEMIQGIPLQPSLSKSTITAVSCAVRKDAGDDPDVTNGVLVYAALHRISCTLPNDFPSDKPYYRSDTCPGLFLTGGEGIGLVTKKGLSCALGFYAINPVPRRMIFESAAAVWSRYIVSPEDKLLIEISVPEGILLAEKTFNPKLGVVGGISILGTSGIVNPMSEQALVETIRLDIRVKAGEGRRLLAVAPGNYGETFLTEELGGSLDSFVKCSNFIGDTLLMMAEEQVAEVLLVGHLGKLIKVAGGVLNTHSKYGDRRMEILCDCAKEAGIRSEIAEKLLSMNTTEEAAQALLEADCLYQVIAAATQRIKKVLEEHSGISVEVVVFSSRLGILGMTTGTADRLEALRAFT